MNISEKKVLYSFTPVIDAVVDDVGLTSAIVFGAIWRYCQMKDGVCKASQQKIADRSGVSRTSVKRHIKLLIEKGYLREIITDNGKVNIYQDTNKVHVGLQLGHGDMTQTTMVEGVDHHGLQRKVKETKNQKLNPPPLPLSASKTPKPKSQYVKDMERLETAFVSARGCFPPDWDNDPKGCMKLWRMPLNRILKNCKGDVAFAERVVIEVTQRMRNDGLTFAYPTQIEKTAASHIIDASNPSKSARAAEVY